MILSVFALALSLAHAAPKAPAPYVSFSCDKKVSDFKNECAEDRAREKCKDNDDDFDQCVADKTPEFLKSCSKTKAKAWCEHCQWKPEGCPSLKPAHRHLHPRRISKLFKTV